MSFPNEIALDIFHKVILKNNDAMGFVRLALVNQQFAQMSRDFALQQLYMDICMPQERHCECLWLRNFPPLENIRKRKHLSDLHAQYIELLNGMEEDEFEVKFSMMEKLDFLISHSREVLSKNYIPFQAKPLKCGKGYYSFSSSSVSPEYILKEIERGKYVAIGKVDSLGRFSSDLSESKIFPIHGIEIQPLSVYEERKIIEITGFYEESRQVLDVIALKTDYYFVPKYDFVIHAVDSFEKRRNVFGTYKRGKFSPRLTLSETQEALALGLSCSMYPHMDNIIDDLKNLDVSSYG